MKKVVKKRHRRSKLIGLYIYKQRQNEIFVDWDRPFYWSDGNSRFVIRPFANIEVILDLPSITNHHHYVIILDRELPYSELITLGSLMGDDRTRTMFDLFRLRKGIAPILGSRFDWFAEKAKVWDPYHYDAKVGNGKLITSNVRLYRWRAPDFTATEENIFPWTTAASAPEFVDNREPNFKGGFAEVPRW